MRLILVYGEVHKAKNYSKSIANKQNTTRKIALALALA